MNTTRKSVAKNASALMLAQLATWVITLILTVFLPRYLGAENMGRIHLASSIWAIAIMLASFGMDILITKEVARNSDRTAAFFGTTVVIRTVFFVLILGGMAIYLQVAGYRPETNQVIWVVGLSAAFQAFGDACRASLEGLERMEYISIAHIASKVVYLVGAVVLVLLGQGVLAIAGFFTFVSLTYFGVQIFYLNKLYQLRLKFDWDLAKWMLRSSIPYLMSGIFLVLYLQVDIVIISLLINSELVIGWYGVADRLFGTFLFIPNVFITAFFPVLSRMYVDESDSLSGVLQKSFDFLLIMAIPIGLGIAVMARPLVLLLFGQDFLGSVPVLAVMGLVLIIMYLTILLGRFLVSMDRQNQWTAVMIVATLASIPLDMVIIPWAHSRFANAAIGGAITYFITESAMVIVGLRLLPAGSLTKKNIWTAVKALIAGGIMVLVVWTWREAFIAIPIILGAVTYISLILLFRVVPKEDLALLKEMVMGIRHRFHWFKSKPVGGD